MLKYLLVILLQIPVWLSAQSVEALDTANSICNEERLYAYYSEFAPHGYCMFYDLDEAKFFAKKQNKPLFICFGGLTCTNCQQMEQKVWTQPKIKKLLTEEYVIIYLYVDNRTPLPHTIILDTGKKLRTVGDKWLNYQTTKYNSITQPYFVLTDTDDEMLVLSGKSYSLNSREFSHFLKEGLKKFKQNRK